MSAPDSVRVDMRVTGGATVGTVLYLGPRGEPYRVVSIESNGGFFTATREKDPEPRPLLRWAPPASPPAVNQRQRRKRARQVRR